MYKKGIYKILANEPLTATVWRMVLGGDTQWITAPGQFVDIALEGRYLRRPISVCDYDATTLTLIYKVVGEGTAQMSRMVAGRELDLLTGLGNGFDVHNAAQRPLLIAVTQLTSTSEERMRQELLINASIGDTIVKYAQNTKAAGLDGVVCSPLEAGMVHQACGKEFLTITPGVRFADGDVADQVRVTTPARAREIGSDFIVVGRPITAAADPVAAYRRCVDEFCG